MGSRCADHATPLYPQKLALTSPTGGGRSVGIVRSRTKATEFVYASIVAREGWCDVTWSLNIYTITLKSFLRNSWQTLRIPGSWDVTLESWICDCRRFGRTCSLHLEWLKVYTSWTHRYIPQYPDLLLHCYENYKTCFIIIMGKGWHWSGARSIVRPILSFINILGGEANDNPKKCCRNFRLVFLFADKLKAAPFTAIFIRYRRYFR